MIVDLRFMIDLIADVGFLISAVSIRNQKSYIRNKKGLLRSYLPGFPCTAD
jgi:hypothetical protein